MFFQAQETVLSAIGGCSVEQGRVLRRVRCGSVPLYTTKPAQAQGSRLPAMRHRSLNNFHKKWDNNSSLHTTDKSDFFRSPEYGNRLQITTLPERSSNAGATLPCRGYP